MSENLNQTVQQSGQIQTFEIDENLQGQRLDKALSDLLVDVSRSQIQTWIKDKNVAVNGTARKQTYRLENGDQIVVTATELEVHDEWVPEDIELNIIYEDDALLVINKPAGLVVHPGAGNLSGTLLNGLLHYLPDNAKLARAGIVHRLDKDTSGLMVVAKQEAARLKLSEQLADRTLSREYQALSVGNLISGGTVNRRMNRDRHDRRKMAVVKDHEQGREAITHYRIGERFRRHTLLKVKLETGRTHQIRVHLTHAGFPLVGDPVYGKRLIIPKQCELALETQLRGFKRQALHATAIEYIHPVSGESQAWQADLPEDMQSLCDALAEDCRIHGNRR